MQAMRSLEGLGSSTNEPALPLHGHPACEWVGVAEDGEEVAFCARPAYGAVLDRFGALHYTCLEHVSETKAKYESGKLRVLPGSASARPYPESIP
jgi:hypothetical protein